MITETTKVNLSIGAMCGIVIWTAMSAYELGSEKTAIIAKVANLEAKLKAGNIVATREYEMTHDHIVATSERLGRLEEQNKAILQQNDFILKKVSGLATNQPDTTEEKKPPWIIVDEAIVKYGP